MRRFDTRAIWAALLFSLALAACGGSDSDGSSASPSASNPQSSLQNGPQSSQQMAGASANASVSMSAEDNAPGAPDMHWAPDSSASGAH